MKNFRRLLLTASLSIAAAGIVNAASITQTFSLPSASDVTTWTGSSTINTFNESLGTLNDIQIIAILNTTASSGAVDNNPGGPSNYTIAATTSFSLSDPSSKVLITPSTSIGSSFSSQTLGQSMAQIPMPRTTNGS
jgi:hypothetical protein